jgi:hypothetical protein
VSLDHGLLNLPLGKRGDGDIDAQLDRWRQNVARAERSRLDSLKASFSERREEAESFLATLTGGDLESTVQRTGKTLRQVRKALAADARTNPDRVIKIKHAFARQRVTP